MERIFACAIVVLLLLATSSFAQPGPRPRNQSAAPSGDYASDIAVVHASQEQALEQARQLIEETEEAAPRHALETAVEEMERARSALDDARKDPARLPAAIAAEQAAYQALLKAIPRERQIGRARNAGARGGAGQPNPRQLDELEMQNESNRYETERMAAPPQTPQQREQAQTADRLRQLARRQQDLNERLRELQNALTEARTDREREEIQRQLKRLQDEQRQMLDDVDELRQRLDRSPDNQSLAETRQQLDNVRSDLQRAAQELEEDSVSQALAAGARAQERMQDMREDLRRSSASGFTEQMRQLRSQARELTQEQEEVARGIEALGQSEQRSLRDSPERQRLLEQMNRQQSGLTNLLGGVRSVTEQAEATEPLLANQLYDTLRRADQAQTERLLDLSADLVQRGFLPQASEVEQSARQNLQQLRQGIERAAESVLGDELAALRYAQNELDDLTRQAERELDGSPTNVTAAAAAPGAPQGRTNQLARAAGTAPGRDQPGEPGQDQSGEPGRNAGRERPDSASGGAPNAQDQAGNPNRSSPGDRRSGQPGAGPRPDQQQASGEGRPGGGEADRDLDRLRQVAEQLGGRSGGGTSNGGPVTSDQYLDWIDRLENVEQVLDSQDLRNQLATVRERVGALRADYRRNGRVPETEMFQNQVLTPMTQVRVWLREELVRRENARSLVPLDRDPVPDTYSELVRRYFEQLGSAQ